MGRRLVWLSAALAALACQEDIVAPGSCPAFCPPQRIVSLDTVLAASVSEDTAFRGFSAAHGASLLQAVADPGGIESRVVVVFEAFTAGVPLTTGGPERPVLALDSFRLGVTLSDLPDPALNPSLAIHRIPATTDTSTSFVDLEPFFEDSTLLAVASIPDTLIPDTLTAGRLEVVLPGTAFPSFDVDEYTAAVGIALRTDQPAFLHIAATEALGLQEAGVRRFATVDSADGIPAERNDARDVALDRFVATPLPPAGAAARPVGGVPAARTFLSVDLPPLIIDSSDIVRATLVVFPDEPVLAAPGDTVTIRADVLAADFGPKSPLLPVSVGAALATRVEVVAGTTDSVMLDVTVLMQPWGENPDLPRKIVLRLSPEAASFAEVRLRSVGAGGKIPYFRVTYAPRFLRVNP